MSDEAESNTGLIASDESDPPVIVIGRFEIDPARREEFLQSRLDVQAATRKEPGCLSYAASADPLDAGVINMLELWRSRKDFQKHLDVLAARTPEELAPLRRIPLLGGKITQYEVAASGPVPA
jgi:quinol monooxygenase YgiN